MLFCRKLLGLLGGGRSCDDTAIYFLERYRELIELDLQRLSLRISTAIRRCNNSRIYPTSAFPSNAVKANSLALAVVPSSFGAALLKLVEHAILFKETGNKAFLKGEYEESVVAYSRLLALLQVVQSLRDVWHSFETASKRSNTKVLGLLTAALSSKTTLIVESPPAWIVFAANREIFKKDSIAAHVHIFYSDVAGELFTALSTIKTPCLVVITASVSCEAFQAQLDALSEHSVVIFEVENVGRDIYPFCAVMPLLLGASAAIKLHTKRGESYFGEQWRRKQVDRLLPSPDATSEIIKALRRTPAFGIASPLDFVADGEQHIYSNSDAVSNLLIELRGTSQRCENWVFCAGTMFWFRPAFFADFYILSQHLSRFGTRIGNDGAFEHAVERAFGLILCLEDRFFGYSSNLELKIFHQLTGEVPSNEPLTQARLENRRMIKRHNLKGHVVAQWESTGTCWLHGWLAVIGSNEPRVAKLWHPSYCITVDAIEYREDLFLASINSGRHAFNIRVRLPLASTATSRVALVDDKTGLLVAETVILGCNNSQYNQTLA